MADVPAAPDTDAPWAQAVDEVAAAVGADIATGLRGADAASRLERDGPNELEEAPPVPWWARLGRQFSDPLVVLLLIAIAISIVAWSFDREESVPLEAIVIAAIVVLNAGIGYWQEARAIEAVAALRRLSAPQSSVFRDGRVERIPTREIVVGDLLVLSEGDAVGADCRLVRTASLQVSEASLTGESLPVAKAAEPLPSATPLAERTNMAYSGTAVVRGRGEGVVVGTGMDTEVGMIADLLHRHADGSTPLQQQIAWLGRRLGAAVVVLSALVVAAVVVAEDSRTAESLLDALLVGVSLAVAAVPEGLPAILTVVLALGVQRMARRQAIVKRLSSVETLGSASVICSDKTGTLTRSEMTIVALAVPEGEAQLTGAGYEPVGQLLGPDGQAVGEPLRASVARLLRAGSLANDASLQRSAEGAWTIHGDPTEAALLVAGQKLGDDALALEGWSRVGELPFTSERKRMSTLHRDDDGRHLVSVKGAPDVVLERCSHERRGEAVEPLGDRRRAEIAAISDRFADRALRTIAVAEGAVDDRSGVDRGAFDETAERDLIFLGVVGMLDPPRVEVRDAIAEAEQAGIRVIMITGDHPLTAARIGEQLGIGRGDRRAALTGNELAELDDAAFSNAVHECSVFARVEPAQKVGIIDALQGGGAIVAMTGDGVNDAPALHRADIGVAMGITGTEVSKEASDMILADDNFATILRAVREGREILADIRKVLRYLLASNAGEVLVMLIGVLAAGALGLTAAGGEVAVPLLATQILWINLLTDGALALALGVDPAVEDVMKHRPRRLDDRMIDRPMLTTIGLLGVTAAVAALVALDLRLPGGPLGGDGDIDTARTMVFTTLVLAQIFNAFNARSDVVSAFVRPFENRVLWLSIAVTVALQVAVVHLGFLQTAFDTNPLDAAEWGICLALGSAVLWVDELRKQIARAR